MKRLLGVILGLLLLPAVGFCLTYQSGSGGQDLTQAGTWTAAQTFSTITVQNQATLATVSGNVGVGVTAPITKFQVSSGVVTIDGSGAGLTNSGSTTLSGNVSLGASASSTLTVNQATAAIPTIGLLFSTTTDGSGRDTLIRNGNIWLEVGTTTPSVPSTSFAGLAAVTTGATTELKAIDGAGNVTTISPHNDQGEWVFYSENMKTGKRVYVNMEHFIRRMEDLTGEKFMELTYEKKDRDAPQSR